MLVIGTTSMKEVLKDLEVVNCFNTTLHVPNVASSSELTTIINCFNCNAQESQAIAMEFDQKYSTFGIPIKTLLLAVELAIERSGTGELRKAQFMDCLASVKADDI